MLLSKAAVFLWLRRLDLAEVQVRRVVFPVRATSRSRVRCPAFVRRPAYRTDTAKGSAWGGLPDQILQVVIGCYVQAVLSLRPA